LERPASGGVKVIDGGEKGGGACAVHAHDYGVEERGCFFQRLVSNVYVGLKGTIMHAYLDDLAVGSDTPMLEEYWNVRGTLT
jgi:hypothetical protein